MLLSDYQIEGFCLGEKPLVSPFNAEHLNGVSLDIRIGHSALKEKASLSPDPWEIRDLPLYDSLADQNEYIDNLPHQEREQLLNRLLRQYKPTYEEVNLNIYNAFNPYLLEPNEFILVASLEMFNFPNTLAGEFRLRSTYARMGYDQTLATWMEPEWENAVLTLELKNNCRFHPLPLFPGMRIGQIIFHQVSQPRTRKYSELGHYSNDLSVQDAKLHSYPF